MHGLQDSGQICGVPKVVLNSQFMQNIVPTLAIDQSSGAKVSYLKLLAECITILVWAHELKDSIIIIESDNASTVSFLHRETTKSFAAIRWLKRVFHYSLRYDYPWTGTTLFWLANVLVDALSRLAKRPV